MALRARHDLICSLSAVLFLLSVNVTGPCFSSAQQCILAFSPIYNTLLWISSLLISQLSSFPTDGLSERLLPVLFRMITLPFHIKPPNSKYLLYHIFFLLNIMYVLLEYHIIHSLVIFMIVMSLTAALKVSYVYEPSSLIYALLRLSILEASGTWLISIHGYQ